MDAPTLATKARSLKPDSGLGRLAKCLVHFLLVGEQLLDARALEHALEMGLDVGGSLRCPRSTGWRGGNTRRNAHPGRRWIATFLGQYFAVDHERAHLVLRVYLQVLGRETLCLLDPPANG
jgi:hypothetical protein